MVVATRNISTTNNVLTKTSSGIERIIVQSPLVGKPAPDFILTDPLTGKLVSLTDLRGKSKRPVVLFMNAGGGCGTCLAQIVKFSESKIFTDGSVGVASIMSEHSDPIAMWHGVLKKYPELQKTHILIDRNGAAISAYGAGTLPSGLGHGGGHMPGHTYYVIDRDGIVRLVADDENMRDWTTQIEQYVSALL